MKLSPVKREQRLLPSQILQHRCHRRKKSGFVKSLCIISCLTSFTEVKMKRFFMSEVKKKKKRKEGEQLFLSAESVELFFNSSLSSSAKGRLLMGSPGFSAKCIFFSRP